MFSKVSKYIIPALLVLIPLLFFYKSIFFQKIPFPGDLLLGNYEPYKSENIGVPHKGQGADVIRELYPWKYFSMNQLRLGVFPLWNPYTFSGNPHFANLQSGTLNPVNILFFVLPFPDAWTTYIILQYFLLILFTYLYLREIKLAKISSLLGAVAFTFSGFIIVWGEYGNLGYTLAFLPLVLLCIEKILNAQKSYWYLILIAGCAGSIFAGYIQIVIYIYLLAGVYIGARYFTFQKKKEARKYLLLYCSLLAGVVVSAVQLFPLFEFVNLSLRSSYTYKELIDRLMPPESIITLLFPDFFGNPATMNYFLKGGSILERAFNIGLWPIIFTVFAIFSKKSFIRNFFAISALVIYISTLSIPPVAYFHSIGIPFLSTGIPTRVLPILSFCLAVLSAIGVNTYLESKNNQGKIFKVLAILLIIFAILFILTYSLHDSNFLVSRRNMVIPGMVFMLGSILIFSKTPKKVTVSILIFLTIVELFYSFQKFNSFVPKSYIYPETIIIKKLNEIQGINRYWGYGAGNIDANFQIIEGNYTTEGYDALYIKRYGEFISASKNGNIPLEIPRTVANIVNGYGSSDLKTNPYRKRALDLTGVKFILNKTENKGIDSAYDEDEYNLVSELKGWQIYENKNVLPRVTFFGEYQVENNSKKIIKLLYNPKFDFHKQIVLEKQIDSIYKIEPDQSSSIKVISYLPNTIKLETKSKTDQLLFISDNYFPGWKASVDDNEVPILRANYTFRAIPIKAGRHQVMFTYFPEHFLYGMWVSSFSIFLLLCLFIFATIYKTNAKNS